MDYEKAYKESFGVAQCLHEAGDTTTKKQMERLFPQLAESKDERIRKGLIEALKTSKTVGELKFVIPEPTREECITYLEKQKEPENTSASTMVPACWEVEQKEQELTKYLDKDMVYTIMKKLHDLSFSQLIPINSEEYKKIGEITSDVRSLLDYPIEQKPAEVDESTKRLNENWMKQHFDDYKEQKPTEWSEEDEKHKEWILECLADGKRKVPEYADQYQSAFDWLKSLRPVSKESLQPHWKPSEEQMKALEHFIRSWGESGTMSPQNTILCAANSLLTDLQKLL